MDELSKQNLAGVMEFDISRYIDKLKSNTSDVYNLTLNLLKDYQSKRDAAALAKWDEFREALMSGKVTPKVDFDDKEDLNPEIEKMRAFVDIWEINMKIGVPMLSSFDVMQIEFIVKTNCETIKSDISQSIKNNPQQPAKTLLHRLLNEKLTPELVKGIEERIDIFWIPKDVSKYIIAEFMFLCAIQEVQIIYSELVDHGVDLLGNSVKTEVGQFDEYTSSIFKVALLCRVFGKDYVAESLETFVNGLGVNPSNNRKAAILKAIVGGNLGTHARDFENLFTMDFKEVDKKDIEVESFLKEVKINPGKFVK